MSSSSIDSTADPYRVVHQLLNNHIREGNMHAAFAILSIPMFYLDPLFWTSGSINYRLIACLVISDYIKKSAVDMHETQVDDQGVPVDRLSRDELYVLLKLTGDDGSLIRDLIRRIETRRMTEAIARRGTTIPVPEDGDIDHVASTSAAGAVAANAGEEPVDLHEVAAILFQAGSDESTADSTRRGIQVAVARRDATSSAISSAAQPQPPSGAVKRPREEHPTDPSKVQVDHCVDDVPTPAVGVHDPLALPGSVRITRTLEEYDASIAAIPRRAAHAPVVATAAPSSGARRIAFTNEEDEALTEGIGRFPANPGRFRQIFSAYRDVWAPGRTATHLADHWRQILRHRVVK